MTVVYHIYKEMLIIGCSTIIVSLNFLFHDKRSRLFKHLTVISLNAFYTAFANIESSSTNRAPSSFETTFYVK